MELAHLEKSVPSRRRPPKRPLQISLEDDQGGRIGQTYKGSHDELRMLKADQSNQGLAYAGQKDRTEKCPGHSAGEVEMVIVSRQMRVNALCWCAVC